jgi:hypothetical protein
MHEYAPGKYCRMTIYTLAGSERQTGQLQSPDAIAAAFEANS